MSEGKSHHAASVASSIITGGSQAAAAVFAFVRSKMAAVWIGPEGVGIVGLLSQLQNVLVTGFDFGVSNSAVREVAIHRATGDGVAQGGVRRALFQIALWAGIICALLTSVMCVPIAKWMFNADGFALDVALTGIAAASLIFAAAHGTLMRGHGMVFSLAVQRISAAAATTLFAFVGYCWFGRSAIAVVLVMSALATWAIARIQSRQLRKLESKSASAAEVIDLARHGIPFVWSTFSFALVSYVVGALVVDYSGLKVSGYYQAAWGLTAYLVGFVLTAMGQDFLPRLSAVITQPKEAGAMINSQIEVGLLLSLPGMFLFSAFAQTVFPWLFSQEFSAAAPIAQATLLGCLGRVVNWPMLFALNAQRESKLHITAVSAASASYLLFAWFGLRTYGVVGAVGGFVAMQALHTLWLRLTLSRTLGFRFSAGAFVAATIAAAALLAAPFLQGSLSAVVFVLLATVSALRLAVLTGRPAWLYNMLQPHVGTSR
jgi:antigen flippase